MIDEFEIALVFRQARCIELAHIVEHLVCSGLYNVNRAFPDTGKGELYLWVSRHWHYMKQNTKEEVSVHQAVLDFGTRFAPDAVTRFGFFLKRLGA